MEEDEVIPRGAADGARTLVQVLGRLRAACAEYRDLSSMGWDLAEPIFKGRGRVVRAARADSSDNNDDVSRRDRDGRKRDASHCKDVRGRGDQRNVRGRAAAAAPAQVRVVQEEDERGAVSKRTWYATWQAASMFDGSATLASLCDGIAAACSGLQALALQGWELEWPVQGGRASFSLNSFTSQCV